MTRKLWDLKIRNPIGKIIISNSKTSHINLTTTQRNELDLDYLLIEDQEIKKKKKKLVLHSKFEPSPSKVINLT